MVSTGDPRADASGTTANTLGWLYYVAWRHTRQGYSNRVFLCWVGDRRPPNVSNLSPDHTGLSLVNWIVEEKRAKDEAWAKAGWFTETPIDAFILLTI